MTNFCIGSGKRLYRMGKEVKRNWFNLKLQGVQPSTPSREGFYSHHYDDAFDGGSSLLLQSIELIRLFVCELPCDGNIIFSFTFKRHSHENDVQVTINLMDLKRNFDVQIVCDGPSGSNPFAISCLDEDDVRNVAVFLANNRQTAVPSKINGWETRYYLLKFERSLKVVVTDIGVRKMRPGKVLFGHMAFYSAHGLHGFRHINLVQF